MEKHSTKFKVETVTLQKAGPTKKSSSLQAHFVKYFPKL